MATANQQPRTNDVPEERMAHEDASVNSPAKEHKINVAQRVVWYIAGVLLSLLALRFIFKLLGANPGNGLADFIYTVTYPFVAPFFNLFSYDVAAAGQSVVEVFTLVAMLIYALIAWAISKAVGIPRS